MVRQSERNPSTRRAYETAVKDFMRFTGIRRPEEFRIVTRAHIIAGATSSRVVASAEARSGTGSHR